MVVVDGAEPRPSTDTTDGEEETEAGGLATLQGPVNVTVAPGGLARGAPRGDKYL